MTLVLSMNPFCDHESEPRPTIFHHVWEPGHSGDSSTEVDAHELHDAAACRVAAGHVTMSRIAYFKRRYVEDDVLPLNFRSYRHTMSPLLEDHNHVLHLSLDKMRFIDDPEAFLRRSVLINNLLRRLRAEIFLQGAWPFMASANPVSLKTPVSAHQDRSHKRLRLLHREEEDESVSACCYLYKASRYMQLPVCVYERNIQPSSSSSSSSSSSAVITQRLEHLFKDEEEEEEEEESDEEELDSLCPGLDLCEASFKARERLRDNTGEPIETGQQMSPLLEDHNHVLHLSLDKMRFIDDPEAFLRRSVLINNLLRRLRAEIFLQGAWPFMASANPVSLKTPVSAHQDRSHKRLRLLHREEEDESVSACCYLYKASRYMQLPVCVYERNIQPSSSSSSSSSSSAVITQRLEHLFKDEEEEEEEEEESDEEELDSLCPGLDLCEASFKARERLRDNTGEPIETGQQVALVLA